MIPFLLTALLGFGPPPIKGRPDDFVGAVGKFSLSAEVKPTRFRLDETATLTLRLEGVGEFKEIHPPDLLKSRIFVERFDLVGPAKKTTTEKSVEFHFPVRARNANVNAVPIIRVSTYDDSPQRAGYRSLKTAEILVEVLPVPETEATAVAHGGAVSIGPSFGSWTPILIVGIVVAMAALVATNRRASDVSSSLLFGWKSRGELGESKRVTPTKRRRGKPMENPAVFVMNESDRLIDELADALSLPPSRRTSAEILAAAKRLAIEPSMMEKLEAGLKALDQVRFGQNLTPLIEKSEMDQIIEAVRSATLLNKKPDAS